MASRLFGRADWLAVAPAEARNGAIKASAQHRDGWIRADLVLLFALLVSYAFFYQAGGWNQNSRFDLLRSVTEQGTTRIDAYVDNTGDRAIVGDHFYSDKAPGQALTAVPVAVLWNAAQKASGSDPQAPPNLALLAYFSTIWAAGLPTAIAAVCLARATRTLGASRTGATVGALSYGIASPAFAYATELWGNALTAGCLMVGFLAALNLRDSQSRRKERWLSLVVGLACGWAMVSEYPSVPAAAIVFCLALVHALKSKRLWRVGLFAGIGVCAALAVLVIYNTASFGSPRFISYGGIQGWPGMSDGIFGVTLPRRTVLQEILFGTFRGIVPLAPALVLAPIGLVLLWRQKANRAAVAAAAGVSIYYLLFNAAFFYWDGGAAYGPRYIGAAIPFFFFGLAQVWTLAARAVRWLIGLLTLVGAAISTMAVSTLIMIPEDVGSPLTQVVFPSFATGALAQNRQSFLQYGDARPAQGLLGAWNLGQLAGLPGLSSLVPLLLVWLVAAYLLYRFSKGTGVGASRLN